MLAFTAWVQQFFNLICNSHFNWYGWRMRLGKALSNFLFIFRDNKASQNANYEHLIDNDAEFNTYSTEYMYFLGFLILIVTELIVLYSFLIKSYTKEEKKEKLPIVISELTIYPLKSCKGINVLSSNIIPTGFQYDRCFMIINEKDGKFVSQRKYPIMSRIITELTNDTLIIKDPNNKLNDLIVPLCEPIAKKTREVSVWGDKCEAYDYGEAAAVWICKVLHVRHGWPSGCLLRLVRLSSSFIRKTAEKYSLNENGQTGFADGFPFLIASNASLNAINQKLNEKYNNNSNNNNCELITMTHFRPNIVVDGCEAFEEDTWNEINIKGMSFKVCKPCARCTIPNINPNTGEFRTDNEPTATLKEFRKGKHLTDSLQVYDKKWDGQVFFGQNLDHGGLDGVQVCVEDVVEVVR